MASVTPTLVLDTSVVLSVTFPRSTAAAVVRTAPDTAWLAYTYTDTALPLPDVEHTAAAGGADGAAGAAGAVGAAGVAATAAGAGAGDTDDAAAAGVVVVQVTVEGLTPDTAHVVHVVCDGVATGNEKFTTLTAEAADKARVQADARRLQERCMALTAENKALREQLTRFRVSFDGINALRAQQDVLVEANAALKAELAATVAAKSAEVAQLKVQVAALSSGSATTGVADTHNMASLDGRPVSATQLVAEVRRLREALETSDARWEEQYASFVARESALVDRLEAKRAECARLTDSRQHCIKSAHDAAARAQELEDRLTQSVAACDAVVAERDELAARVQAQAAQPSHPADDGTLVVLERSLAKAYMQRDAEQLAAQQLREKLNAVRVALVDEMEKRRKLERRLSATATAPPPALTPAVSAPAAVPTLAGPVVDRLAVLEANVKQLQQQRAELLESDVL